MGTDMVTYTATQPGFNHDNPTDPTNLTELQLQRAVSLQFKDFTETLVTFGSTKSGNRGLRRFDFVGRPSIKCAIGVDPGKVIDVTETTTTTVIETTTVIKTDNQSAPTCCVLKCGPINICCTS